jgi:hypothetical protein
VINPEHHPLRTAETVRIDSHAAITLQYIRSSMEAATAVAVPGSAGIAMGIVGLIAALVSSTPALHRHWLGIWLAAAVIAAVTGGLLIVRPSPVRGLTLSGTPFRKFALCLLPSLFAGTVLTAVLWTHGILCAIPGTWLLLYGCGLIAASVPTTRTIGVMGALFVKVGVIALLLPENMQILMLGIGFGGLHVVFGFLIGRDGDAY